MSAAYTQTSRRLRELDRLFRALPDVRSARLSVTDVLEREAVALREAHHAGADFAAEVLRYTRDPRAAWRQSACAEGDDTLSTAALDGACAQCAVISEL